jgi:hypothetical protein
MKWILIMLVVFLAGCQSVGTAPDGRKFVMSPYDVQREIDEIQGRIDVLDRLIADHAQVGAKPKLEEPKPEPIRYVRTLEEICEDRKEAAWWQHEELIRTLEQIDSNRSFDEAFRRQAAEEAMESQEKSLRSLERTIRQQAINEEQERWSRSVQGEEKRRAEWFRSFRYVPLPGSY